MNQSIVVLGGGMVGSAMALDLSGPYRVTVLDIDAAALARLQLRDASIQVQVADLQDKTELQRLIAPFDLVLNAVPGFMGYATTKAILEAKKNVVDISFFPENCLDLDEVAKANGVTALVDIGVAPGMDNIILGHYDTQWELTDFECLVGGLPKARTWPFCYKAPFSPIDVIEEYTRPARYVENSVVITREALTDPELVEFEGVGTLESFNTDGLRSILFTMSHIPNLKEKTLRYPGHIEYIRVLRESGFLSEETMNVKGNSIRPIDLTSQLLFDAWKLGPEEPEFTVMRVTVTGNHNGQRKQVVYNLHDEYNPATKTSSMARTTGYTATAAVNYLLGGHFTETGVFPPELVGRKEGALDYFLGYLAERNITYKKKENTL